MVEGRFLPRLDSELQKGSFGYYCQLRFAYGEERFVTLGLLDGRVVAVAHTETTDIIRVISMRKATKREQAFFFKAFKALQN